MNIREVEQLTEIKKANIRYYEEEGLLTPERNRQNNYREYTPGDVEALKRIKILRVLGVSIGEIRELQKGKTTLPVLMEERAKAFASEMKEIRGLQEICRDISSRGADFDSLDLSSLDMHSSLIKMRGENVMRIDKIHHLKKLEQFWDRVWKMVVLVYFPLQLTLMLFKGHGVAVPLQLLFGLLGVTIIGATVFVKYRIWFISRNTSGSSR